MSNKKKKQQPTPPPPTHFVSQADINKLKYSLTNGASSPVNQNVRNNIALTSMLSGLQASGGTTKATQETVHGLNLDYFNGEDINDISQDITVDDVMYNNQSGWEVLGHGIGRTLNKIVTETAKLPGFMWGISAGTYGQIGDAFTGEDNTDFMKTAFDNSWIQNVNKAADQVNSMMPVFKSEDIANGNFWKQVTSGTFWATEGADGLGYLAAAMVPGALIKGLAIGDKLLRGFSNVAGGFNRTRALSTFSQLAKTGVTRRAVDNILITSANTAFEAGSGAGHAAQALDSKKGEIMDNFIRPKLDKLTSDLMSNAITQQEYERIYGQLQQDAERHFEQQRSGLMQSVFLANAAILLGPNALQTKLLFNPTAKFITGDIKAPNMFKSAGKGLGLGIASEGFWEEGMQSTVESVLSKYAEKGELTDDIYSAGENFNVDDIVKGYADMISSTDGQKAVFLGALMGGAMNAYGKVKQDNNDFAKTISVHKLGEDVQRGLDAISNIYQEKDGKVVLDSQNNPVVDTQKVLTQALKYLSTQQMSEIIDAASSQSQDELASFAKSLVAKDLSTLFALTGDTGAAAMDQYLNAQVENISNNDKLTEAEKEVVIKDIKETNKTIKKEFNNITADLEAFDLYSKNILPKIKPTSEEEATALAQLNARKRVEYAQAQIYKRTINESIDSQMKTMARVYDTYNRNNNIDKRPASLEANDDVNLESYRNNPLTMAMAEDVKSLKQTLANISKDADNILNTADETKAELEAIRERKLAQDIKDMRRKDYLEVVNQMNNAQSIEELDAIKLKPEFVDDFKNEFDITKQERAKQINNKLAAIKAGVRSVNQNTEDSDSGNDILSELVLYGSVDLNEDYEQPLDYDLDGFAYIAEPISPESMGLDVNDYRVGPNGELISNTDVIEYEDAPNGAPSIHDITERALAELNMTAETNIIETPADNDVTIDENVSKVINPTEIKFTTEVNGLDVNLAINEEAANTYVIAEPISMLHTGVTDAVPRDVVPESPEVEVDENDASNALLLENKRQEDSVSHIEDGVANIEIISVKQPRLIGFDSKGKNKSLTDYIGNHKDKTGDVFQARIVDRSKRTQKYAVEAYQVLENYRRTGHIDINGYFTLLYKLPFESIVNNNESIVGPLDGVTPAQVVENNSVPGGVSLKPESAINFMTAFPLRVQLVNEILGGKIGNIDLSFSRQFGGFLNKNRKVSLDGSKAESIHSPLTSLLLPNTTEANRFKFIKNNLAYVDFSGAVKGLANNLEYSNNARTSGIIYLRVPDRAGNIKNIQVSRRKLSSEMVDIDGIQMSETKLLANLIYDSILNGGNPQNTIYAAWRKENPEYASLVEKMYPKPLSIIRGTHGDGFTMHNLIDFFVHTSGNTKTKLSFTDGVLHLGEHARNKTSLGSVMADKNYVSHLFFNNDPDNAKYDGFIQGMSEYLDLIKLNVNKEYANNNLGPVSDLYVEYLTESVLTTDLKPNQPAFVNSISTLERTPTGFKTFNKRLDDDLYFDHRLPNTDGVNKTPFTLSEIYDNLDPSLRPLLHVAGIVDNTNTAEPSPIETLPQANEQGRTILKEDKGRVKQPETIVGNQVIVNINNNEYEDTHKPETVNNTEDTVIVPYNSIEQQKADIERRRQEELNKELTTNADAGSISKGKTETTNAIINKNSERIKSLRNEDGSISKENLEEFNKLRKQNQKLAVSSETIKDTLDRLKGRTIKDIIYTTFKGVARLNNPHAYEVLKQKLKEEGFTEDEINQILDLSQESAFEATKLFDEIYNNKINAKYDAELAALEKAQHTNIKQGVEEFVNKSENKTTVEQPSTTPVIKNSITYTIGNTTYDVYEKSDGSFTIARRTKKGSVKLKEGIATYDKVFALYKPEEALAIKRSKQRLPRPKPTEVESILVDVQNTSADIAVALYFFSGGVVSRKGFENDSKGRRWYEGLGVNKASDNLTSETLAESIYQDLGSENVTFDEQDIRNTIESFMSGYTTRRHVKEYATDLAYQIMNSDALMEQQYYEQYIDYRQEVETAEVSEVAEIFNETDRESDFETDEEIINYYEQEFLNSLQALPADVQAEIYEQWASESDTINSETNLKSLLVGEDILSSFEHIDRMREEAEAYRESMKGFKSLDGDLNGTYSSISALLTSIERRLLKTLKSLEKTNPDVLIDLVTQTDAFIKNNRKQKPDFGLSDVHSDFNRLLVDAIENYMTMVHADITGGRFSNPLIGTSRVDYTDGRKATSITGYVKDNWNFLENFKKYLNNEQTETQTVRGNERGATPEVYSSTESQEDIHGTHEAVESIESIESAINELVATYEDMKNREQTKTVKNLLVDSGITITEDVANKLSDVSSRRELFGELIANIKTANELTNLKDKICRR